MPVEVQPENGSSGAKYRQINHIRTRGTPNYDEFTSNQHYQANETIQKCKHFDKEMQIRPSSGATHTLRPLMCVFVCVCNGATHILWQVTGFPEQLIKSHYIPPVNYPHQYGYSSQKPSTA